MKRQEIIDSVKELNDLINKCKKELHEIQKVHCKHKNKKVEHKGNTGNYDPHADIYWDSCTCFDCGLIWTENESSAKYGYRY